MEKLELENLAPYLPFKLKIQLGNGEIKEMIGIRNWIGWCVTFKSEFGETNVNLSHIMPLLHPKSKLQDLKDEIFICWGAGVSEASKSSWLDSKVANMMYSSYTVLTYDELQFMFQNHIDVFGLIGDGLAIINTY